VRVGVRVRVEGEGEDEGESWGSREAVAGGVAKKSTFGHVTLT